MTEDAEAADSNAHPTKNGTVSSALSAQWLGVRTAIGSPWLELALTGIDLLAWAQALLLDGKHAASEPTKLHYRLLHVAAHLTRTAPPHPHRPPHPATHRRRLALGRRPRAGLHPARAAATTCDLTTVPRP